MKRWLSKLTNNNAQGEYYITDIIAMAYQEGREIAAVHPARISETEGVNNRLQLSRLERVYQSEQAEKLLLAGVMLRNPARLIFAVRLFTGAMLKLILTLSLKVT